MRRNHVRRFAAALIAIGSTVILSGSPAAGGGVLLDFEREWYMPGDVARGMDNISRVPSRGWIENGPYQAYLVSSTRFTELWTERATIQESWASVAPEAIPLGPLRIEPIVGALASVSIAFEVPDLPAGSYTLFHCNDPCTMQVGDLVGGGFWIGGPPPPTTLPPSVVTAPPPSVPDTVAAAGAADEAVQTVASRSREDEGRGGMLVTWIVILGVGGAFAAVWGGVRRKSRRPVA